MKKKTCRWLDSNLWGGIQILDDAIYPCCGPGKPFFKEKNLDYSKISIDELIAKRKELQEQINEGTACQGCEELVEKEESNIDVGKISYLSIGLFSTCNLRCKYCYFTHEELSDKLTPDRTHLLPFVKRLAEKDFLKENFSMGVAGGEPTLLEDIPETLKYLEEHYKNPSAIFLSNSSITQKVNKYIKDLKNNKVPLKLYTSVDAGCSKTFKLIRGKDLFKNVSKNLINYAKNNIFKVITLKYILMFDHSNTSDKDIFGFLELFSKVMLFQKEKTAMTIDCDMNCNKPFDEEMIIAAGKLYYAAKEIFEIEVVFSGGGLVHNTKQGRERIDLIEQFAHNYKPKGLYDKFAFFKLKTYCLLITLRKIFNKYNHITKLLKIIYFQ